MPSIAIDLESLEESASPLEEIKNAIKGIWRLQLWLCPKQTDQLTKLIDELEDLVKTPANDNEIENKKRQIYETIKEIRECNLDRCRYKYMMQSVAMTIKIYDIITKIPIITGHFKDLWNLKEHGSFFKNIVKWCEENKTYVNDIVSFYTIYKNIKERWESVQNLERRFNAL